MIDDQLVSEMRAKVFWGDPPEEILALLETRGIPVPAAKQLVEDLEAERDTNVRALGRRKIFLGTLLVPVPFVTWLIFNQIRFSSLKLLGVAAAVGLFGVWKIILGLVNVLSPRSIRADLSDNNAR